jgi:hypothetical protein
MNNLHEKMLNGLKFDCLTAINDTETHKLQFHVDLNKAPDFNRICGNVEGEKLTDAFNALTIRKTTTVYLVRQKKEVVNGDVFDGQNFECTCCKHIYRKEQCKHIQYVVDALNKNQ